jgi:hypothetical protein
MNKHTQIPTKTNDTQQTKAKDDKSLIHNMESARFRPQVTLSPFAHIHHMFSLIAKGFPANMKCNNTTRKVTVTNIFHSMALHDRT